VRKALVKEQNGLLETALLGTSFHKTPPDPNPSKSARNNRTNEVSPSQEMNARFSGLIPFQKPRPAFIRGRDFNIWLKAWTF
jgi:hypothetical protein